jgi:hypothetical protein
MKVWALFTVDPDGDQLVSLNQSVEGAQQAAVKDGWFWLNNRGLLWMPEKDGSYYATLPDGGSGMLYTLQEREVGE